MTERENMATLSAGNDRAFDDLVCDVSAKLEAGEAVDLDAIASEYPEHVDRLRKLLPTLQAMAELGHSDTALFAASPETPESTDLQTGVLGDYRILREIGRGGMGVVYEAEQVSLGRKVALKVLPFAAMLDQRQLQRFQNEARAAASLRHPNIVQVHFVGCERAVHFYAMDYIEGQTLAELIHHLRRPEGLEGEGGRTKGEGRKEANEAGSDLADSLASGRFAPPKANTAAYAATEAYAHERTPKGVAGVERSEPPASDTKRTPQAAISTERSTKSPAYFRSIAEIGAQVAEALDHAHEHGVIHRDVKPSNVILDNGGKPWVTDFGLARIETDATLTVTGDLLGTVRYMSPEQALAKRIVVDHRTDVYSLGVTLYELLTLQPVFDGQDRQELLRQIAFDEPKSPRRLNKAVPEELEIIVLKAMAKNPAERYDTAQELADDLQRFLEDRPIRARRPTLVQRAAKWSRRHKPVVVAAVVLLVMATFGFAASTLLIAQEKARTEAALGRSQEAERRARESEAKERNLAKEAQRLKRQAERNLERARDNLERALEAADQLVTCLEDDRFFVEPETQELRQTALREAMVLFRVFLDQHGTDPAVRYQTARAHARIGSIQMILGRAAQSDSATTQAISVLEQLVTEFPSEGQYRAALAEQCRKYGQMLCLLNWRVRDAEEPIRRAIGLYEKLIADGPDGVDGRLEVARYRWGLIACRLNLIRLLEVHEAEKLSRELTVEAEKLASDLPAVPLYRHELGNIWRSRGLLLMNIHRFDEASEAFRRALEVQEQLVAEFPNHSLYRGVLAAIHCQTGILLSRQERLDEAEDPLRKGIAICEELSDERPSNFCNAQVMHSYYQLAAILDKMQRVEEVAQAYQRARDAARKNASLAPEDPIHAERLAESSNLLGSFLKRRGQHEKALEAYRHEQGVYEKLSRDFPEEARYKEKVIQGRIKLADMIENEQLFGKAEEEKHDTENDQEAPVAKPN